MKNDGTFGFVKATNAILISSVLSFLIFGTCFAESFFAYSSQQTAAYDFSNSGRIVYSYSSVLRGEKYSGTRDASTIAKNLDMYITFDWEGYIVDELHEIKPGMTVLIYRNFRAIYSNHREWVTALNKNWILKDTNGNLVHCTCCDTPEYMVDIGNPDYQIFLANWIKNNLNTHHFDGVFADYGLEHGVPVVGMTANPLNPRTKQPYTDVEWISDLINVINLVKDTIGTKIYFANGIQNGLKFYDNQAKYIKVISESKIDGFMSEGLFFSNYGWYSEAIWKKSLDFLVWARDNFLTEDSRIYAASNRVASGNIPSGATKNQLIVFIYTSFLLGARQSQTFLILRYGMHDSFVQGLLKVKIGEPLEDYHVVLETHVYEREFSEAKVLVNPSEIPRLVSLGATYYILKDDLSLGLSPVTETIVNPHSGVILIKAP